MNEARQATEAFILKYLKKMHPGGTTEGLYKKLFESWTDQQFDDWILQLERKETHLVLYAPIFSQAKLTVENNLAIAKELGYEFFQKLWMPAKGNSPKYLTPIPYMVVDLPVRRVSQLLAKKIKIPENNRTVDTMTGQPTGPSKGSRVSFEELKLLAAMELDHSIVELFKYRGGDNRGHLALNAMISRYGTANQETLEHFASGVESTKTFSAFLKAMHYQTDL